MFRKQFRQICRTCKGTGTSTTPLKDKAGRNIFVPEYHDPHDRNRVQFEMCDKCDVPGSGMAMYDSPTEVFLEGTKIKLEADERKARFNDATA